MPQIFDNINKHLVTDLKEAIGLSHRADFCVGYFNLRGWKLIDDLVEQWDGGKGNCCRLMVGMQRMPQDQLRSGLSLNVSETHVEIDNKTARELKRVLAQEFREQLTLGFPTNEDEAGLRRLACQLSRKKLVVKLYLRHPLHAKLYLLFRNDRINPTIGYLGSSNLTMSGLSKQGELNIDVLDHDACDKLAQWFEDLWADRFCVDISEELVEIINTSWAREEPITPYEIYIKMAYHLSQEARAGLSEFRIPSDFGDQLFDFQVAAVKIAAHHLNKRGGVVIGDVVGLGKTLMATALAKIFEDDYGLETLIVCPKNLVTMWEDYSATYRMRAKVLSITMVQRDLPQLRRYRLVVIDESHNLRNRESERYKAIAEYISTNDCRVILLSATPYNKSYLDLSSQLRLFVDDQNDIGIRPEKLLRNLGETEFIRRHQCSPRSLAAFEKSDYADDWRELMRLYLVRRTRGFIQENYARSDPDNGLRYLEFADGTRSYFPQRIPKTIQFPIEEQDPEDQYARLFADPVVETVNSLALPRYGLGNYEQPTPHHPPTPEEVRILQDLSRSGVRLKGFCRTNLFKRLESSGHAFCLSVERHLLRNHIFLYAIANNLPLPIGSQGVELLDDNDEDSESLMVPDSTVIPEQRSVSVDAATLMGRAERVYKTMSTQFRSRFKWLKPTLFVAELAEDLHHDCRALLSVLAEIGCWHPARDRKLEVLQQLLQDWHPDHKVLVFSQFADTVDYLTDQLSERGVTGVAGVTGATEDPTRVAYRFSPISNNRRETISPRDELRVVIATDVLSEGQNLQDCAVIVNYDLPWAIIRLIQRAGRVDRIGQQSNRILCYSFMPAEGVERVIRLRARVRERLEQNAEVVGADEAFFEDQQTQQVIRDLFTEKAGILDGDEDTEVDLASYAYQIWKNATDRKPSLAKTIPDMSNVVYSTRPHQAKPNQPEGALVYLRTSQGNDALAWVDHQGRSVTESQFAILKAAECRPDTPPLPRHADHHQMVEYGVRLIVSSESPGGGQLGRPGGARFKTFERLKAYAGAIENTTFDNPELKRAVNEILQAPLLQSATDTLNRQIKAGISDSKLAELVLTLRADGRLCHTLEDNNHHNEPQIICSMGLKTEQEGTNP